MRVLSVPGTGCSRWVGYLAVMCGDVQAVDYSSEMGCKCSRDGARRGDMLITLVYDNACNLYHYFLAREPELARRFKFFVDRFHFKGHRSCSPYMSHGRDSATRETNSSANEQMNRSMCIREINTPHM